jgi:hypothetical protein
MACYLVKLDSKGKKYCLADLIKAINPGERNSFSFISLQANFDNTDTVLGGDDQVSTGNYGWWLAPNSPPRIYDSDTYNRSTLLIFLFCSNTDNQKIAVEVI